MARLRIVIEGEMSPEEMKQYIAAAWGCNVPRDVAISTVDLDEPSGTVDVPVETITEPAPVVETEAPPEPVVVSVVDSGPEIVPVVSMADRLNQCKKIIEMIDVLGGREAGLSYVLSVFRDVQAHVPLLLRLGDQLEDRITRTFEGMK
jgi:hypothetical protein